MSMTDPVADMLTRIRNAQAAAKVSMSMMSSKLKEAVAKVLLEEGYISGFHAEDTSSSHRALTIDLKYHEGQGVIEELHRVSRPGLRIFRGKDDLPRVLGGMGIAIVSTSKGVMSDRQARAEGQGGEVLCVVS